MKIPIKMPTVMKITIKMPKIIKLKWMIPIEMPINTPKILKLIKMIQNTLKPPKFQSSGKKCKSGRRDSVQNFKIFVGDIVVGIIGA